MKNLLVIKSHNGKTPDFPDDLDGAYKGYFANEHGEQLVFIQRKGQRTATLYHGDDLCGPWHPIVVGKAMTKAQRARFEKLRPMLGTESSDELVPDLVLNHAEKIWLRACWEATEHMRPNKTSDPESIGDAYGYATHKQSMAGTAGMPGAKTTHWRTATYATLFSAGLAATELGIRQKDTNAFLNGVSAGMARAQEEDK